jgi:hypothetical protein
MRVTLGFMSTCFVCHQLSKPNMIIPFCGLFSDAVSKRLACIASMANECEFGA